MAEPGASADRAVRPGTRPLLWNLGLALLVGAVFGLSPHTSGHRVVPSILGGILAGLAFFAFRTHLQRRRGAPAARVEPAWQPPLRVWLTLLLAAVVFAPTAVLLYDEYTVSIWTNAHGLFVPLAVVYLGVAILRRDTNRGEESSAWGFLPIVLGLALVVLDSGVRTAQLGALGIAISLPGFSLLLLGARRTKALALPLFLAFFLVPLPTSLADLLYLPTGTAAGMVPLLERIGLPVLRERTVLILPQDMYGISANCSGFATLYAALGVSVPTGVGIVLSLFGSFLFSLPALILERLQVFSEVIGENGAVRRVIRAITAGTPITLAAPTPAAVRIIKPAIANREHRGPGLEFRIRRAQRRIVIKNVETASKGHDHEVALTALNLQVTHGNGWQTGQFLPVTSTVVAEKQAKFGSGEQKVRIHMVLDNGVHRSPDRQPVNHQFPAVATIHALHHVGLVIPAFVIVEHRVGDVRIVARGDDVLHQRHLGHALEDILPAPVLTPVFADMDKAIIGSGVKQTLDHGTLIQRDQAAIDGCGPVFCDRINTPHPAHDFQLVAITTRCMLLDSTSEVHS